MCTKTLLLSLGLCLGMHASQLSSIGSRIGTYDSPVAIKKLPAEFATELGQRLIKTIKNYDNNQQEIERLLKLGPDVNARDEEGNTALIAAAANYKVNHLSIFEELHGAGFDLNARNNNGNTALMEATARGQDYIAALKSALEKGTPENLNFLRVGYYKGAENVIDNRRDIVWYLINHKAHVGLQNNKGETALLYALKYGHHVDGFSDSTDIDAPLLYIGYNNRQDKEGNTPLMIAAKNNAVSTVTLLLNRHVKLTIKNKQGQTAFDFAKPYPAIVEMLHDAEAQKVVVPKKYQDNSLPLPPTSEYSPNYSRSDNKIMPKNTNLSSQEIATAKSKLWGEKKSEDEKDSQDTLRNLKIVLNGDK